MVEIRETVKEIVVPGYVQTEIAAEPQLGAEEKFIFAAYKARVGQQSRASVLEASAEAHVERPHNHILGNAS